MGEYNFTIGIEDVTYSNDVFLEKLRNQLNKYNISTFKSKEKTGHANTVGVGAGFGIGVGGAATDMISHQWNPFEVVCPADKFNFFGKFKGSLKVSELSHYQKKTNSKNINFKNFEIYGGLDYKPSIFLAILVGFIIMAIFTAIILPLSFLIGLIAAVAYYFIIKSQAMKEINFPVELIEKTVNEYQKEIKDYVKKM